MTASAPFIEVQNVSKTYPDGMVQALKGVDLSVAAGEFVCLMGPSGSGKSTLLHLLGTIDRPTSGEVLWGGKPLAALMPLHLFRASNIGFVFQFHHLLPTMTLLENVAAPLVPLGIPKADRFARAERLLVELGLGERRDFLPSRVSGGERQRAAIARALVNSPRLVLADEPTGQLDDATAEAVVSFLLKSCETEKMTLVLATHNPELARLADRIVRLKSGSLEIRE